MSVLINLGSSIGTQYQGWTNTVETARRAAQEWFDRMTAEGFIDIELIDTGIEHEGRWKFLFHHTVTGVDVALDTHGIDNMDAYLKHNLVAPRVYWNGSSSSEPDLDDFAAPGFAKTMTFTAVQS